MDQSPQEIDTTSGLPTVVDTNAPTPARTRPEPGKAEDTQRISDWKPATNIPAPASTDYLLSHIGGWAVDQLCAAPYGTEML